ncbi:hypothetical protein [Marinomonas balearica]|uniref:MoaA/NifB/PqqE/SkfB family radical SAM enzyme n=1 Tax=Marinomonas balearica TaxID=491947 RepID=A0A4V3CG38_9GAMM|nr:hypothetical protein [Marinomonas balearica]TDO96242.1 MoaA/NifB/PqqE/SkfB family radical SAM enzyme [Marinomonas balearica]
MMSKETLMVRFPNFFRQCNFHCPYCTADVGADNIRYKWPYRDNHRKILENLLKLDKMLNIRLGPAGEFFVSKDLVEDARWLTQQSNVEAVNLITNMGFTEKQYSKFFEGFNLDKVALTVSYHPTEIKDTDVWKKTILTLAEKMPVSIVLVAYPPLVHMLPMIHEELKELNIPISVNGFIGSFQGEVYPYAYTEKQKEFLKDISFSRHEYEFWINGIKPGLCNAGYKSIFIDIKDGKVYSCGMPKNISLGELLDGPNIDLLDGPLPCMNSKCMCDSENYNPVVFDEYYDRTGIALRQYEYKFKEIAMENPLMDEWNIAYW